MLRGGFFHGFPHLVAPFSAINNKQDRLPVGDEGQVWTAGNDGTGSWQNPSGSSTTILLPSAIQFKWATGVSLNSKSTNAKPITLAGVNKIKISSDFYIAYFATTLGSGTSTTVYYASSSDSLSNNTLVADFENTLIDAFGIPFDQLPNGTYTIQGYFSVSTRIVSGLGTKTIQIVVTDGTYTINAPIAGEQYGGLTGSYFHIQSVSYSA